MGLLGRAARSYVRDITRFPTKDDRRREFQRAQWRKRVDAEMKAQRGASGGSVVRGLLVFMLIGVGIWVVSSLTSAPAYHGALPNVIGKAPNIAENKLGGLHINYVEHGDASMLVDSDWVVCRTVPAAGERVSGAVQVYVKHWNCSGGAVNTPLELLRAQDITRHEYELMRKGRYVHNDPACVDGIDTSSAHAGALCLPRHA